jgi:hypothetical protein
MKDIVQKATLANDWATKVEKKLANKLAVVPNLLTSFYSLRPTSCDFYEEDFSPMIQASFVEPDIWDPVESYFRNSDNKEKKPPQLLQHSATYKKRKPKWKDLVITDDSIKLEEFIEFNNLNFSIPIMSLFTHIGIRVQPKEKGFCLWPACQPNVNNRSIPMKWIYDGGKENDTSIIKGIVERGDLGWTAQSVHFLPYAVTHGSDSNEKEAPMFHVISDTAAGSAGEETGVEAVPEESKFDGNLHARLASYEDAVEAFAALSVSLYEDSLLLMSGILT